MKYINIQFKKMPPPLLKKKEKKMQKVTTDMFFFQINPYFDTLRQAGFLKIKHYAIIPAAFILEHIHFRIS